jgi:hypothetical protein
MTPCRTAAEERGERLVLRAAGWNPPCVPRLWRSRPLRPPVAWLSWIRGGVDEYSARVISRAPCRRA